MWEYFKVGCIYLFIREIVYWFVCVEVYFGVFVVYKSDFVGVDCKMSFCRSLRMEGLKCI